MSSETIISVILLLLNGFGLVLMGMDKRRAKKHLYRISERTLWMTAIIGGATGMMIGMWMFHHKTKHVIFKLGFPLLSIIHIVLFGYYFVI